MLAKTKSYALYGLTGFRVDVEVDVSSGLPGFDIVGLPDTAVKESKERVRSAIKNSGMRYPNAKITVNLAPADLKKQGAYLDLAIAVGILKAGQSGLKDNVDEYAFIGELSLDGKIRSVTGLLPMLISAKNDGSKKIIIPTENVKEIDGGSRPVRCHFQRSIFGEIVSLCLNRNRNCLMKRQQTLPRS